MPKKRGKRELQPMPDQMTLASTFTRQGVESEPTATTDKRISETSPDERDSRGRRGAGPQLSAGPEHHVGDTAAAAEGGSLQKRPRFGPEANSDSCPAGLSAASGEAGATSPCDSDDPNDVGENVMSKEIEADGLAEPHAETEGRVEAEGTRAAAAENPSDPKGAGPGEARDESVPESTVAEDTVGAAAEIKEEGNAGREVQSAEAEFVPHAVAPADSVNEEAARGEGSQETAPERGTDGLASRMEAGFKEMRQQEACGYLLVENKLSSHVTCPEPLAQRAH